ncbi:Panacea domain-containing protein [Microbacterium sp. USHLN186]|uniref:Panacea domain-containing protein n=1 Tax=Microbacterium sp. USHLN186 TaxID=3081286 RepID=UPI00301A441C
MKLQKLCFLAQGWNLGLLNRQLFSEDFEAWANGPVAYALFDRHRGKYTVSSWSGNPATLDHQERIVVDAVLRNYGALTGLQLSEITHEAGSPWARTRIACGVREGQSSNSTIPKNIIRDYYADKLIVTNAGSNHSATQRPH